MNVLRTIAIAACLLLACGDSGDDGGGAGTGAAAGTGGGAGGTGATGATGGTGGAGGTGTSGTSGATSGTGGGSADPFLDLLGINGGCNFDGSPFGHQGTGTIRGMGTLPAGLAPGLQLNLSLDSGSVSYGVIGENLFDVVSVCDAPTFLYQVTMVEAGTYELYLEVLDPNNDAAVVYESAGDVPVTVTDGAIVEQDVRFD